MSLKIELVSALSDNYIYLLEDEKSQEIAVVDPAEKDPVIQALKGRTLHHILNTHHHYDHTGANLALKKIYNCSIYASEKESYQTPGADHLLKEGDTYHLGESQAKILETPGHTLGHIAFYFQKDAALFCGDTLFSIGCGRVFEGTHQEMWESLCKLRSLEDQTRIFSGHEYTLSNIRFALSIDPKNAPLQHYLQKIQEKREKNIPSLPSLLGLEKQINPFLRADDPDFKKQLGQENASDLQMFAWIRQKKDSG